MSVHDEVLAQRVQDAVQMDKRLSGLAISVRVSNGDVFLKGSVDSLEELDAVQFIVSGIPGVRHVDLSEVEVKEAAR
ncbi:MAG TPA: BON domain-containing protein [Armatimonadota bacterium]|nr:BON domain-containing protein [Armatimonadota bacterium]